MTKDELDTIEQAVHDAWSMLNLVIYGTQSALMSVEGIEGEADTQGATYRIANDDLSALWGSLEVMRYARDMLKEGLDTF